MFSGRWLHLCASRRGNSTGWNLGGLRSLLASSGIFARMWFRFDSICCNMPGQASLLASNDIAPGRGVLWRRRGHSSC